MRCSTLMLPSLRSSTSQLTKLRSSKQQVGELPWNSVSTFHILLLSTDLAAFLNYEQIIIHICPRLVVTIIITNGHCCTGKPHGLEILTSLVHITNSKLLGYHDNQRLLLKNHGQSPFYYYDSFSNILKHQI